MRVWGLRAWPLGLSLGLVLLALSPSAAQESHAQKAREMPDSDLYEILGVPRGADPQEIKKVYRDLALKWHPDKWFNEGGAFEGIEASEVSEEDTKKAKAHFYEISTAHEILSDPESRKIYDETKGGLEAQKRRFAESYGTTWGQGCHNHIDGCRGQNNVFGQVGSNPDVFLLGDFDRPFECLQACQKHKDCCSWAYHESEFDGGENKHSKKCYGRQGMVWRAVQENKVISGFCPSAPSKYKFGQTSLLAIVTSTWEMLWSLTCALAEVLQADPRVLGTLLVTVITVVAIVRYREHLKALKLKQIEADRQAYRDAELARIKEEIEERKRQKELERELKREAYESKRLEAERREKEAEASEILLREKMQSKYHNLEQKKRAAREAKEREEEEEKKRKEEERLKKALPGLYREVAKETGEYTDNIGNTSIAAGRRLGGMANPSEPRLDAARQAQERLDAAVGAGEVPDTETLIRQREEQAEAEKQEKIRKANERVKKALPNVAKDAADTLGSAPNPVEEAPPSSVLADPRGVYAAGAAAAAAERRERLAAEGGQLAEGAERYEIERQEREEKERLEKELREKNRQDFVKKAVPEVWKAADSVGQGHLLGAQGQPDQDPNDGEVDVIFRDSSGKNPDVRQRLAPENLVQEAKELVAKGLGQGVEGSQIRIVYAGKVLKDKDTIAQVLATGAKIKGSKGVGPSVFHIVVAPRPPGAQV